ncbi:uncharacterized protein LOC125019939 [Mugil cephalus]|uniref:uncharacterized protein LOC125019939 n=1 Tax=Mugil cephalus TaxID=48193 RepID=UPI001FB58A77|nr:uncharacterized protein LOC125019939 [Mugil cephalus]
MMEFAQVAVAVLSLLSVAQSAPVTDCETLTQTIDIKKDQLQGRWTIRAEASDAPSAKTMMYLFVQSVWLNVTNNSTTDTITIFQNQKMLSSCFTFRTTKTLKNNTLTMEQPLPATDVLLRTSCPDCLVWYSKVSVGNSRFTSLDLLSRRGRVSAAEMEEFKKQASCLNLPSPSIMDPEEEYCPDPSESQDIIDLTDHIQSMSVDETKEWEEFLNSGTGLKMLIDMISKPFFAAGKD